MLTTLSSFVACSPGSSESWKEVKVETEGKRGRSKSTQRRDAKREIVWNVRGVGEMVGKEEEKKTKEKSGKEDVVQTFVNHILQNWYTYFILSDRRWGRQYVNVCDMLGCSDMHDPAWHDPGVTRDLWHHQTCVTAPQNGRRTGTTQATRSRLYDNFYIFILLHNSDSVFQLTSV